MARYIFIILSLALLGFTLIEAQRVNCTPTIIPLKRGQRFCQLNCPPRLPRLLCVTAIKDIRLPVCPHGCCRLGNTCAPLKREG